MSDSIDFRSRPEDRARLERIARSLAEHNPFVTRTDAMRHALVLADAALTGPAAETTQ